jgi:hypothetical protein
MSDVVLTSGKYAGSTVSEVVMAHPTYTRFLLGYSLTFDYIEKRIDIDDVVDVAYIHYTINRDKIMESATTKEIGSVKWWKVLESSDRDTRIQMMYDQRADLSAYDSSPRTVKESLIPGIILAHNHTDLIYAVRGYVKSSRRCIHCTRRLSTSSRFNSRLHSHCAAKYVRHI